MRARLGCLIFLAVALGCHPGLWPQRPPEALRIALTFDDVPWLGATASGETRLEATQRLLQTLRSRGVQATGFVNCARIDPEEPIVEAWLSSGMEVGNHTSHHLDLNQTDLGVWIADVEDCHATLSRLAPRSNRYFRYPMLHEGATEERHQAAVATLQRLGYATAHVTVDNSEWILSGAYSSALRRQDAVALQQISKGYVEHLLDAISHFDRLSREALGRSIPHVVLLHANAIAADHVGEVIDALRARGAVFVPLREALADPAFSEPERYLGPKGLSWLYRIRPELLETWGAWDDEQADALRQRFQVQ